MPRAVVVGAGLTGTAVKAHLEAGGFSVDVIDDAERPVADDEVERLVAEAELVYPSAGVPPRHAAWRAAEAHGVPVVGELDLAQRASRIPVVAITATNGKTTITTLVAAMLEQSGIKATAAGNIGFPVIEAVGSDASVIVAEVSSFQLYAAREFRPSVALWANASPNHLDWHGTFDDYIEAKARIYANQTHDDVAVANAGDAVVMKAAAAARSRLTTFGPGGDYRVTGGRLLSPGPRGGRDYLAVADMKRALPHDISNALAATATAVAAGAELDACARVLSEFDGLPHRVELVGEAGGVRWFNDSKATTPGSVLAAIGGFESVVLIAGGRNKGVDLSPLASVAGSVRAVVAIGEAADEIEAAFSPGTPVARGASMDDAVTRAACLAREGDVVLLSPGCASYDWYGSYTERGDDFKRAALEAIDRVHEGERA